MFNFNVKNRLLNFKEIAPFSNDINLNDISKSQFELNLVNPPEIFNFIKDKDGLIEFILETHNLIRKYFPKANLYLKFVEDPEIREMDILFTYIINPWHI